MAPELLSLTGHPNTTNWDVMHGYNDSAKNASILDSYPHRILGTGARNGLSLLLYLDTSDLDYLCQGPIQGFKVVLHSPAEVPLPSKNFFRVPLEQVCTEVKFHVNHSTRLVK